MALRACRECKKEVSTEAKTCPHCGAKDPTMSPLVKLALYGGSAVLLVGMCTALSDASKPSQERSSASVNGGAVTAGRAVESPTAAEETPAAPEVPEFTFRERERKFLESMIQNEMDVLTQGGETILTRSAGGETVVAVTADKLQRDYDKNEVAADMQYRKKRVAVRGRVASIDRGFGESYSLALRGGTNSFMRPRAAMADGHEEYLAGLKKGNSVTLVCKGQGMLMGSASLSDCEPSDTWVQAAVQEWLAELPGKAREAYRPALRLMTLATFASTELSEKSSCWAGNKTDACWADVERLLEDKNKAKASAAGVRQELASRLGIDVTVFDALNEKG